MTDPIDHYQRQGLTPPTAPAAMPEEQSKTAIEELREVFNADPGTILNVASKHAGELDRTRRELAVTRRQRGEGFFKIGRLEADLTDALQRAEQSERREQEALAAVKYADDKWRNIKWRRIYAAVIARKESTNG